MMLMVDNKKIQNSANREKETWLRKQWEYKKLFKKAPCGLHYHHHNHHHHHHHHYHHSFVYRRKQLHFKE